MTRNVRLTEEQVIKKADPQLMRVEVEKTRRGGEIGKRSGLFRVPEVIQYQEATGTAVYERLHDIVSIRKLLNKGALTDQIMELAGRSLAIIHRELTLPEHMRAELPAEFASTVAPHVYLHGDYNGENICWDTQASALVILDWQTTGRHGGSATYGPAYFDLIWFANHMLWTPSVSYLIRDYVTQPARRFIAAYFQEAQLPYDRSFAEYAVQFFKTKQPGRRQHRRGMRHWLRPRSESLTESFSNSLWNWNPAAECPADHQEST